MRPVLPGIGPLLADEGCTRLELRPREGGAPMVFLREEEDGWVPADGSSEPLHTAGLIRLIGDTLGEQFVECACRVGDEEVCYRVRGRTVSVSRRPCTQAEQPADFGAVFRDVADALGIPRSRRGNKFRQAVQFARIVQAALGRAGGPLRMLDLACGRSYLGFVLGRMLATEGRTVSLTGVDNDPVLVERSRQVAQRLGWQRARFEVADLAAYAVEPGSFDLAVALHACDTLTDEAIRIGWQGRVPLLFLAPCCQHEMRHQLGEHPLQWISRYGLLEQRLADTLTDAFRCLVLEALGYEVKVLRFSAPEVTPKNLLIQAQLTGAVRPERVAEALEFMKTFGVRPRLAALLDDAKLPGC